MIGLLPLLRRGLGVRGGRAAAATAGVAAGALLVLILFGIERSLTSGVRNYAGTERIDYWVGARGTDNLIRASSQLPVALAARIRELPDVAQASCVARGFVKAHRGGAATTLLVLGYDRASLLGAPQVIAQGALAHSEAEVALDTAAAFRLHAHVGDPLDLGGQSFRLSAITEHTNLIATQLAFVTLDGAARIAGRGSSCAFVAVKAKPGAPDLTARLEQLSPDLEAHARADFRASNVAEVMTGFHPIASLLSVMGIASASLLLALLVHGLLERSRRELAVLLALGVRLSALVAAILLELELLVVLGVLTAAALALGLRVFLAYYLPSIDLDLAASDLLHTLLLLALCCSLSIVPSLVGLLRLDPMEAFRS